MAWKLDGVANPTEGIDGMIFNDGKVSPDGTFFAGTMNTKQEYSDEIMKLMFTMDPEAAQKMPALLYKF